MASRHQFSFRMVLQTYLIICATFLRFGFGQYSEEASRLLLSRTYGSSNSPTQPRNTLRHGLTKLNSSVSFGINESEIAAIFRGVAYGVTRSYPPEKNVTTTTLPTTSSTTTTTTTTSTTTTMAPKTTTSTSRSVPLDINNQNERNPYGNGFSESSLFPNAWDDDPQNQPSQLEHDTSHRSFESLNIPTPPNGQQYPGPYEHHENYNTEQGYISSDGVYMHANSENNQNRQNTDSSKVNVKDVERHEVVDYAWVIHVYLTGVLMGVVAAMAICCISRIHFCSPIFPRNFFVTMHILVFLAAFLRCILLFNGSFGEAHSKLPKVLTGLLINSVPPCLTAAFALVLLVFLKATHLYVLPTKYQSSFGLAVISVVHIVSSVIVDICAGLSESESIINALKAGIQAVTAGWGIILCLGFIFLIAHLWKNEEMRAVIPKKSLQVIYVAVAVELILACFTIYGIVTPRATKNQDNDNTWSLWILASCERLLEACFCVTLLVITTTFTLTKCNNAKPQEQKVFSVMSTGKRDVGLGRSANVYPVTSDKGGFLANGLFSGNLDPDNANKSENYYSGWMEKYAGTIDSTTSDFQLINGKGTSTMSTVLYPPFGNMGGGESGDDSAKDSYITNGQESSATSYSTLSSYRQVNPGHLCYCAPVASCCPNVTGQGFPGLTKQPVLLVSQFSHPQVTGSVPQSEESSSGSSYYGSSLGSSHIYSSPQYYTCPTQVGEITEVQLTSKPLPVHIHQCSEINNARVVTGEDTRHIPSASLPILQDIPENNQRILQYRPKQPLPQHEMQLIANVNGTPGMPNLPPRTPIAKSHQQHHHPLHHPHPHLHHHIHPHLHIQPSNITSPSQECPHPMASRTAAVSTSEMTSPSIQTNVAINPNVSSYDDHNKASSCNNREASVIARGGNATTENSSFVKSTTCAEITGAPRESNELIQSSEAIETIEGSDCSFLNKLVRSPEGQILSGSLELDRKRMSSRRKDIVDQPTGVPIASAINYRQHMALDDVDLPSQIV